MKFRIMLICALLAMVLTTNAKEYKNAQPEFRFRIPDEYQEHPIGKNSPAVLYSFVKNNPDGTVFLAVTIERMQGTIAREGLPPETIEMSKKYLPPGSTARLFKSKWKGFELDGVESTIPQGEQILLTRTLQVPIAPNAIQVVVAGLKENESSNSNLLQQITGSIDGPSNWLNKSQRLMSGVKGLGSFVFLCVTTIVIVAGIKKRNKK